MSEFSDKAVVGCISAFLGFTLGVTSKPIQDYIDLVKEIRQSFIEYANCYGTISKGSRRDAAVVKYREYSGRIASIPHLKLFYFYLFLGLVPNKIRLNEARKLLILFSNQIITDDWDGICKTEAAIRRCLDLEERVD